MYNLFIRQLLITFFLCCASILLVACGFHLRGRPSIPPQINSIYIESSDPYGPFTQQLRQTLGALKVAIAQNAQSAPLTLAILHMEQTQHVTSLSTSTQLQTYTITYTVSYELRNRKGQVIVPSREVSASRDFSISPNQALGSNQEQALLIQDMYNSDVNQILSQLASKRVTAALVGIK